MKRIQMGIEDNKCLVTMLYLFSEKAKCEQVQHPWFKWGNLGVGVFKSQVLLSLKDCF